MRYAGRDAVGPMVTAIVTLNLAAILRSSIRLTDSLVEPVLKKVSLTVSTMPSIY